jgi:asparagine synthase (glutamine-hydrolysing)
MLGRLSPAHPGRYTVETLGRAAIGTAEQRPAPRFRSEHVLVVFDGHLYDAPTFTGGENPAAIVAALYERGGFPSVLRALNGDFAIALFDEAKDELWLARDRLGVKPLYYAVSDAGLAFASRAVSLIGLPGVTATLDARYVALVAASHYRYFDNNPAASPYRHVAQLPAAHMLRVSTGGTVCQPYWSLEDSPDLEGSEEDLAAAYRELLFDAVRRRFSASRTPAFTLSGGMDSSSVLALAVEHTGTKQNAVSVVYDDATYDESNDIREGLNTLVSKWHPCRIGTPDVFGVISRMLDVHDEPVATATWLAHFIMCEQAAGQGFGALFGGLGGDELNAGEYEHFLYHFADLRRAGDSERLALEIRMWIHYHDHPIFRKTPELVEALLQRLTDPGTPGRCRPDRDRLLKYTGALRREYFDLTAFEPAMDHPFRSYLKNRTFQDLARETTSCCLRAEDRQSEAFGLDHFLPFLDHRLVELMFRIPGTMKIRDGVTKHLLRQAMAGTLPEVIRTRVKKTGWNAPAHQWFAGRGRDQLMDMVRSTAFRERGIYDAARVEQIIDEHDRIVRSGEVRENHMMFLWQLVNVELWHRMLEGREAQAQRGGDWTCAPAG